MPLILVKSIRGGTCHAIHQIVKANNKYMKDYDKYKKPSCPEYWYVNNLYGWPISKKLPVNKFERIKDKILLNLMGTS